MDRKLNRLEGYDYSTDGYYFVTICTKDRECYFGEIINNHMELSKIGFIAKKSWREIPKHFVDIKLDAFCIMPNHIHGIIIINEKSFSHPVGNRHACSLRGGKRQYQKLPIVIGSFKSAVTKISNRLPNIICFEWQKSYHDNIIRDENALYNIRQYIQNNPLKWNEDRNNVK